MSTPVIDKLLAFDQGDFEQTLKAELMEHHLWGAMIEADVMIEMKQTFHQIMSSGHYDGSKSS